MPAARFVQPAFKSSTSLRERLGEGEYSLSILIDYGGVYGEIARFSKAKRRKKLPISDLRPEIPQDFRRLAPSIKKGTFLMA